jgi:hypothetical protein
MIIECKDTAYKVFIDIMLRQKKKVNVKADLNKSRHKVIEVDGERIYLIYKREFFNTFSKQFPEFIGQFPYYSDEKGESINPYGIYMANKYSCDKIVFAHKEGFFWIYTKQLENFCEKYNLIRKQERGNDYLQKGGDRQIEYEETYCFPASMLQVYALGF